MKDSVQKCAACHCSLADSNVKDNIVWCSEEKRKKIMKICLTQTFSDLMDSSVVWRVCSESSPPFCSKCLGQLDKLSKMEEQSVHLVNKIDSFVDTFTMKVLRSRKKKNLLELSSLLSPDSDMNNSWDKQNELFSPVKNFRKICCKMCHKDYVAKNQEDKLEAKTVKKILHVCEKYLFKEVIDNDSFDWNSIGLNKFLSFCTTCLDNIKTVYEMNDEIVKVEKETISITESFALTLSQAWKGVKKIDLDSSQNLQAGSSVILESQSVAENDNSPNNSAETMELSSEDEDSHTDGDLDETLPVTVANSGLLTYREYNDADTTIPIKGIEQMTWPSLVVRKKTTGNSQEDDRQQEEKGFNANRIGQGTSGSSAGSGKEISSAMNNALSENMPEKFNRTVQQKSYNKGRVTTRKESRHRYHVSSTTSPYPMKLKCTNYNEFKKTKSPLKRVKDSIKCPHSCKQCGRQFTKRNYLAHHRLTGHV